MYNVLTVCIMLMNSQLYISYTWLNKKKKPCISAISKHLCRMYLECNIWYYFCQMTSYKIPDLMKTFVEHVACKLVEACETAQSIPGSQPSVKKMTVLLTGGGAFNKTLVEVFRGKLEKLGMHLEASDNDTICFKEALVFAFLGLRCIFGEHNVFKDVTGSESDSVAGSIHLPVSTANDYCITYFHKKKTLI